MKVCLAGSVVLDKKREIINESKFMLESFYTIKEWQVPILKKCDLFLLDSGAFTFLNNFKGTVNWDEYVEKYANFIKKYNIKYFFELDIDSIVGIKEVERLRNKLEKIVGRKCIPVWHKSRGLDYWKKMVQEYDYVAIGGVVIKEIKPQDYKYFIPLLKIAKENNCKVHGLGFTATKQLKKYHFYSVDSTSWNGITRFNAYDKYDERRHIIYRVPKNDRRIKKEERDNALIYSFNEWLKFQKYADKYL